MFSSTLSTLLFERVTTDYAACQGIAADRRVSALYSVTVRKNAQTLLTEVTLTYHLVLNRARWFALSLSRALLMLLIKSSATESEPFAAMARSSGGAERKSKLAVHKG